MMDQSTFNKKYVEFCAPFVNGLRKIYSTMLHCEIKPLKPEISRCGGIIYGDQSAVMGMNGVYHEGTNKTPFRGSLLISWPKASYLKVASAMVGVEYTEYLEEIADVGCEICNMTMGSAKTVLVECGYHIEMSIPTAVTGKEHQLQVQQGITTILLPFECAIGSFFFEISLAFDS